MKPSEATPDQSVDADPGSTGMEVAVVALDNPDPQFPDGVTVTDKRGNPEPGGFSGIVVEAPGFITLLPPGSTGISFEALESLARAVRRKTAS